MPARPLLLPVARNSRSVCQLRYYNACYLIASEYTVLLGIVEITRLKLKRSSAVFWDAGTRPEPGSFARIPSSWLLLFFSSLRTAQNEGVGGCRMARLETESTARIITSGSIRGKYKCLNSDSQLGLIVTA